jgi:RNA-binding protein
MTLSNKQMQHLKGLAHTLKPVVQLGNNGLTEGVLAEIDSAIKHHELIKVKIPTDDKEEKTLIMDAIVRETGAIKVHTIGHVLVLYKSSDDRKIELPKR